MDKTQLLLIDLLNDSLGNSKSSCYDLNLVGSDNLYKLITSHGFRPILFPVATERLKTNVEFQKVLKDWSSYIHKVAILNLLALQQVSFIINLFNKNAIEPIVIKGLAIARFYKNPEYRTMGDLDLLIPEEHWHKAKELLIEIGYTQEEDDDYHPMHVKFMNTSDIAIELHRSLIHTGYLGKRHATEWYNSIWNNKKFVSIENFTFLSMSVEDEIINQIIHFTSHFVFYGTKLKHIYEIALIINNNLDSMDWSYIEVTLDRLGFKKFAILIFSVCKNFFNVIIPSQLSNEDFKRTDKFVDDLLNYISIERNKDDFKGYLNILSSYKWIFKHPVFFQPLIWAIECKSQLNLNGFKLGVLIKNSVRNVKTINKKIKIIRRYKVLQ